MNENILLAMRSVHGSHLYGTDTEKSDKDFKGVFANKSIKDLLLRRAAKKLSFSTGNDRTKNTAADTDVELYELLTFIEDLASGQTICIDMIHTPAEFIVERGPLFHLWQEIQDNRSMFYTKNMNAFIGYAKKQAAKYGLKGSRMGALEELVNALPVEPNISPAVRLAYFAEHLPTNEYCVIDATNQDHIYYEVLGSKYQLSMPYRDFYKQVNAKWKEYGDRARAAKDNNGIDWKAVSHAMRAAYQLQEIFQTGDLVYPLFSAGYLKEIKAGKLDFLTEVQPQLEKMIKQVEELATASTLPEKVNLDYWHNRVLEWYRDIYGLPAYLTRFVG